MNRIISHINPLEISLENDEAKVVMELIERGHELPASLLSQALKDEYSHLRRKSVLIALKQLYKNKVLEETQTQPLTLPFINLKVTISERRSRINYVRRIYKNNPLFAMSEICQRYPGYSDEMLLNDLKIKRKKRKRIKRKPIVDLRRCQLEKMAVLLRSEVMEEAEYNNLCCRIAIMQHAHNLRMPIPLAVKLNSETAVYCSTGEQGIGSSNIL